MKFGIVVAAMVASLAASASAQRSERPIWIIENHYGEPAIAGGEVGRRIFYCDGAIEEEGQLTGNAYLEYVNQC